MPLLQSLIDKVDSAEIVRDAIAKVIFDELQNQQALAVAASKDPLLWTMDVYTERDFPIEKWAKRPLTAADKVSSVTVSIENSSRDPSSSSRSGAQEIYEVTYLIDVLSYGESVKSAGTGYTGADYNARLKCHADVRLIRNILSATPNRYLGLEGLPDQILWGHPHFSTFEYGEAPVPDEMPSFSVWNGRGRFVVKMTELDPEYTGVILEQINITVSDDGQVLFTYTTDPTP